MELVLGNKLHVARNAKEIIAAMNKRYLDAVSLEKIKFKPVWENKLVYDSTSETLEPLYFWILDFMQPQFDKVEKLVDNFTASPGSGYFAEIGARATRMQEEGMKILGMVNTVVKSVINIIYDLREFEIRLKHYKLTSSKNKLEKETGLLGLKQIWMDNVDIKRGRGSINMLTYEMGFTTLRDAFMKAASIDDVDKMDLNDRVKRILKPRIAEFLEWWKRSESELLKRYEIEKSYLKSQISVLKLYTRWVKPYLKAAEDLRTKEMKSPHLVNIFNTMILELSLLGRKKIDIKDEAYNKNLPDRFLKYRGKRNYYACVLIDFTFRGLPRRIPEGHFVFGGRSDVEFTAFALNDDEILMLEEELDNSDISDALKLTEVATTESLSQLQNDISTFLKEDELKKQVQEINPFKALFSFDALRTKKKSVKTEDEKKKKLELLKKTGIPKDNYVEKIVRELAEMRAAEVCFRIFDIYKKGHDMAAFPGGPDFLEVFKSKWKAGFA